MNPHDRAVDHLHLAIVRLDKRIHQPVPNAGFAPAVDATVSGRIRPISLGQIAPRRSRARHPEDAVENAAAVTWLAASMALGRRGSITLHSKSVGSQSMIPAPMLGSLNHGPP